MKDIISRLFFNTGRRINNGLIRLGHSILELAIGTFKSTIKIIEIFRVRNLNNKLKKTCYNFKPDLIIFGHADLVSADTLSELKDNYPNLDVTMVFRSIK